jgi:simple sugar transport system ATP-binding protein
MGETFLELKGIKKSFGGVKALRGVDLTVNKGEIHCLAGENGCGKSTLIKVISGAHAADEGEVRIEGKLMQNFSPIDAIRMGVQVIYQDFAIFPNLTVAENIAMNRALESGRKRMDWKESRKLAVGAMEQIGARIDPDALVERLSVAHKQMVAICRAILGEARLLILDEPTTALTAKEVESLFAVLKKLKAKGIAIMIVTHKIDEIFEIADRLTILRNGENAASGDIGEFDRPAFIKHMTGREILETKYRPENPDREEILRVEGLTRRGAFENVSFALNRGDVLGITGLLGSGRGEIGEALFGLAPAESGRIFLHGKEIRIRSVGDAAAHRFAYVPEDRLTQGLFLERPISDNIAAASVRSYFRHGRLQHGAIYDAAVGWIRKISIAAPSPAPPARTLSGGNQQKVVIAKWLNTDPALLILNGPTVGVDVGAKADIHQLLHQLAQNGVGVIVISDDLSELVQNCNQIILMRAGRIGLELESAETDEAALSGMLNGKVQKEGS